MKSLRVLVTQGELKQTLGIVRELGKFGHVTDVLSLGRFSIHGFAVAAYSSYCNKHHKVSTYTNESVFLAELIGILKREKFDFVLPVGAPFVEWIVRNRAEIEQYAIVPFASEEKIRNFENKKFTAGLAESLKIPVPRTLYPESVNEVEALSEKLAYPVVIKANKEVGGNIVDYAANPQELILKYQQTVAMYGLHDDLPMLQEYLTGQGAGFFALYEQGKYLQGFQHLRIREYPVSGGSSTCAKSVWNLEIFEYGKRLLDAYKWDGVAMVEFKYNSRGVPCLLEVNPKFWGSYDLSSACGINFANKLILSKTFDEDIKNDSYQENVVFSWPFNGDIQHCFEKGKLFTLFREIITGKVKTNFTLNDISGSLFLLINWMYGVCYNIYLKLKRLIKL